jgi:Protein of unknown function (DUF3047)
MVGWRRGKKVSVWAAALGIVWLSGGLGGCALPTVGSPPQAGAALKGEWDSYALPGKRVTRYQHTTFDGRSVIRAQADASASMYRRRLQVEADQLGTIDFSWWVPALIKNADLTDRDAADSPVRVVLAFDGDVSRLPRKDRLMFELAETLSGHAPPYAALMYVWDNRATLETVVPGGRSDRIRKIVVDSGPANLRSWRLHRRDIVRDFERAFGEPPGRLIGVALMTDSDNTASQAQAMYGALKLTSPEGVVRLIDE